MNTTLSNFQDNTLSASCSLRPEYNYLHFMYSTFIRIYFVFYGVSHITIYYWKTIHGPLGWRDSNSEREYKPKLYVRFHKALHYPSIMTCIQYPEEALTITPQYSNDVRKYKSKKSAWYQIYWNKIQLKENDTSIKHREKQSVKLQQQLKWSSAPRTEKQAPKFPLKHNK